MSKKKQAEETRTSIDNLNDSLTSISAKVQANKKLIINITIGVVVLVAVVLIYLFMIRVPSINKANANIGAADRELLVNGNDSTALALYQQAAEDGYGAGNRAKLEAAILLYDDGKYEEALSYVSDYSVKDDIVGAAAYSLKGDCLVNLDRLDEAASAFEKAIAQSDKNEYYTPFFMVKLARVYRAQGKFDKEAKTYEDLVKDYPVYSRDNGSIEKDLERARLRAAGK